MNLVFQMYCRIFQLGMRAALPVLPYRNPEILDKIAEVPQLVRKAGLKKPLIITDRNLSKSGTADILKKVLTEESLPFALFDGAYPNPTTELAGQAFQFYRDNGCDSLIAFGGGSPMDLAKAVGILAVTPHKPLRKLAGILKVGRRIPTLIAIPTTAGTGSETTLAAVLIDSETRHKFAINDFPLIPRYAVLDPAAIHTLPPSIAAETGIDALTHAVEAYIGRSTTRGTRRDALEAVRLIFANLDSSCAHESAEAEAAMLQAAHLAGRAFTRSYVGYIHAVSHSLSGKYDLPHGRTNAILLPVVLRMYGERIHKKLARLAICAGLGKEGDSVETLSEAFISSIEEMNSRHGIPNSIPEIREEDLPILARYAAGEANPLYPVPILWDAAELQNIYRKVMKKDGIKGNSELTQQSKRILFQRPDASDTFPESGPQKTA